jgi:hypothetical protein
MLKKKAPTVNPAKILLLERLLIKFANLIP